MTLCSCCPCTLIIGAVLAFVAYKFFCCKKRCRKQPEILEKNFQKDVVYLYQFPRYRTIPNFSPYCLKIEAFLRLNKIKYENRYTLTKRSVHGLLPFIELNGEQIGDSQIIEEKLKKHFGVKTVYEEENTVGRAASRLISHHTSPIMIKYKMIDETEDTVDYFYEVASLPSFLNFLKPLAIWYFKRVGTKRVKNAIGIFSDSDFDMLLRKDLDVVKGLLGEKNYLLGDKISNGDASIFGHVATWYYMPKKSRVANILDEDYKAIVDWMDRVKKDLFAENFEQN